MKIIHVTDLHLVPPGEKLWGFDPMARFEACLADIERHHRDAAFCVITGPLVKVPPTLFAIVVVVPDRWTPNPA